VRVQHSKAQPDSLHNAIHGSGWVDQGEDFFLFLLNVDVSTPCLQISLSLSKLRPFVCLLFFALDMNVV
jgi:hypothetical protein